MIERMRQYLPLCFLTELHAFYCYFYNPLMIHLNQLCSHYSAVPFRHIEDSFQEDELDARD